MIKTAMILAAGRGERMRPLTDSLPKPLISVAGKPLIQYHIERLATAGIKNIVINHAWLGDKIEEALGDGSQFHVNIQYSAEGEALETAGGIVKALPLLGNEHFLVLNGDVYCDVNLWRFCSEPMKHMARLLLVNNPEHNPDGDFSKSDGVLSEKKTDLQSFTFSGIAIYHPEFFAGLKAEKAPLAPLIRQHMSTKSIQAQVYSGHWSDVGTPERLKQLEQELA